MFFVAWLASYKLHLYVFLCVTPCLKEKLAGIPSNVGGVKKRCYLDRDHHHTDHAASNYPQLPSRLFHLLLGIACLFVSSYPVFCFTSMRLEGTHDHNNWISRDNKPHVVPVFQAVTHWPVKQRSVILNFITSVTYISCCCSLSSTQNIRVSEYFLSHQPRLWLLW